MQRSLKILTLVLVTLFLLAAGVDRALDHQARATAQNSFVCYNEKGETVLAYEGDLNLCPAYVKPTSPGPDYRWF